MTFSEAIRHQFSPMVRFPGGSVVPLLASISFMAACSVFSAEPNASENRLTGKSGDMGDGTYRNPVLASDYSDPCVIRVGDDYYMATSTFQMSPGVTILHSRDLVNWETVGAAIADVSKLGPEFNWDRMNRYGLGVYAPTLRHHDGKFWIFVNCYSGEGFYVATAVKPDGPWDVKQILDKHGKPLRTSGWTDPCPFWDDDGKAYLASSRPGNHWFSYLFEMKPDGTQLLDADADKMNASEGPYAYPEGGTLFSPFNSSEGNKIFKRNGYYYLVHIEFLENGQGRGTYVFRSKNLFGTKPDGTPGKPGDAGKYEVFKFGPVSEDAYHQGLELPGQGAFVDTPDGHWFWMGQFNRYGAEGRTPNLLPVTWLNDWPVPGGDVQDGHGKMVWQAKKTIQGQPITKPQAGDEFNTPTLHIRWQWNYQPRAEKWSLTERPGFLRLHAFKQLEPGKFFKTGNVICQRHFRTDQTTTTAKFDLAGMAVGQTAGLVHFNGGTAHASIDVVRSDGTLAMQFNESGNITPGPALPAGTQSLWLRTVVGFDDFCSYTFSTDGSAFTPLGKPFKVTNQGYRGDLVGIYTFNNASEKGFIDADWFHYDF